MAEIKSTMDMVLERAARMAATAPAKTDSEDLIKKGMRLAADYMNRKDIDLAKELAGQPVGEQAEVKKGMAQTLLRNVVLPRSEELQVAGELAVQGIIGLAGKNRDIATICRELEQILKQYGQHKEQMTQQLDDAIRAQLEQQSAGRGQAGKMGKINPAMHPQYREELGRMMTGLNNQYNDALDQRKDMILQHLSTAR
ncbi:MAG TPA: hypothetical protein DCZ89_08575 [Geobacter sulfurreducens]|nr:hypothetical protein [Geobacter sulfurreducens]HBG18060.1 hypothetical protein [Desulfobulbaceae bacterium]